MSYLVSTHLLTGLELAPTVCFYHTDALKLRTALFTQMIDPFCNDSYRMSISLGSREDWSLSQLPQVRGGYTILDINKVTEGDFSTKQIGNQKSNQLKSSVMYVLVKQVHPLLDNKLV